MSDKLDALRRRDQDSSLSSDSSQPNKKYKLPGLAKALPWLLLAAFGFLAWMLFGDRFESARSVEMIKVITTRASAESAMVTTGPDSSRELSFEGSTLFQASGWIEADPLPIRVTTLYSGVVEKVHVLQGQKVTKGQLLATMVDEDARLDLRTAKADYTQADADLASRRATVEAKESLFKSVRLEVAAANARLNELKDESDRLEKAGREVFRESQIRQTALRVESQKAIVEATRAKVKEAEAQVSSSQAAAQVAEARLIQAEVEVDRRQLALNRTEVRSPVDGRVQELYAAPGMKRMLAMDGLETATIAKVYLPESLQARIDVPLEVAAQLRIGQPVRLRSTLLPNQNFKGQVTRVVGQADIQRNTLQAKVKILNPDEQLRPEMLCRAEFLALPQSGSSAQTTGLSARTAIYVPEAVLIGSGRERTVWALGADGERVELRNVVVDSNPREGHLRVLEGLRPGEFVVQNPPSDLESGERVKDAER